MSEISDRITKEVKVPAEIKELAASMSEGPALAILAVINVLENSGALRRADVLSQLDSIIAKGADAPAKTAVAEALANMLSTPPA